MQNKYSIGVRTMVTLILLLPNTLVYAQAFLACALAKIISVVSYFLIEVKL